MVKHRGNKPRWYVDDGKTRLLWFLRYHKIWFYHVTNNHSRNTILSLIRCFTIMNIQYHGEY